METEVHVARQPIFDSKLNVVAYELLFRNNLINACEEMDGDRATNAVAANSFLLIGIETLTDGKKAFINFTTNALKNNVPAMLPKKLVAVEILENVFPDAAIISICQELKQDGYLLVLDDFVFAPEYMPLIQSADIIKVDFRATPREERLLLIQRLKDYPIKFLAEKVGTQEEFKDAQQMGYSYFQGYFFCKPVIVSRKNIPSYKVNALHILQEINRPELEFQHIEEIIKRDLSLSYKLLKFINSSSFGFRNRIHSIRQALTLLGQRELVKWASLITLKGVASDKPGELILKSLIRARFGELLATRKMSKSSAANAFLMGMFSHIDVLLDQPMRYVLDEISLSEEIKGALMKEKSNQFSVLYNLIQTYESGDWEAFSYCAEEMGIDTKTVLTAYRESLVWAHDLLMIS